jgi:hypothetical protein
MSKISTYEVAPLPKLSDKLIGTSVGGEIEDATYNFTLQELLDVFLPVIPANNLQGILDYGNTATQDINLFGTINTTNLNVTDTANIYIAYLNEETHIVGSVFDSLDLVGTPGQVLTSTGDGVEWYTLPPIFTPNLQQVLEVGNTADIDIILDANLQALDVTSETANVTTQLTIQGTVVDYNESAGSAGQVLESTVTGVQWTNLPVYSATSPLLFNPATGVFSIQVANSTQNGYLSSNDWVTFNGKQNAGSYITALTGEATATGPGSVPITLNNASVIAKVLTGLNVAGGSISASDSILTAFGKVQNQINGLVGGVQYQGTWNADTNTPILTSSVGTQGHFYIVNVAGNTNLNGITDWKVGDWAIFNNSAWTKVDNTESVTSVNGQVGAVSLTTDDIPEGSTNLYYLNSRARAALSFAAGSGAYNSLTGVITIPTDNNQILNGAGYITLASLSATAPLSYNALTGAFSIPKATTLVDGYLSAIDWTTFNNKQNYLGGTGLVKSTAGTITYITDNSGNWNTAYDRSIISAAVTGTTTKTLTLNEQDGGTITASWTDLDTGLTSVGVSMPSAFSVANSPLTSNGTIAVTGAGTSLQYIDGTGALQTFPGLTGFVPYTGATANVDLGTFGLISDYLRLNITPSSIPTTVGTMSWNNSDGTMDIRLKGGNVTLQVGEETVVRVVNKSGVDLLEANYQVVRVRNEAEGGAQGQRLAVVLARANTKVNHTGLLGIVTETINSNQEGFVTNFGIVRDIDTTGDLQGETWADGDVLWLSETTAGALTNVEPTTHPVQIGYVTYAHANNGKIFVYLQEGVDELDELHDVNIVDVANNDGIFYNSTTSFWENKTIAEVLGYTPANAATNIATTAPLQGGGDLSANRTFSITQSGAASDGYLSSIDWNTFNNKQPAGSYVPTSRLLSINGTQYDLSADRSWSVGTVTSVAALTLGTTGTDLSSSVANGTTTPVITLNVPTASAANRGALSAADWSTFNTKVGSVTASSPLASSGGSTPNITIQTASGSQSGALSSTDWNTFNNKQAAGNYITSLTGEATATGPGAAAVTLNNASVTAKVLTGINITGGTVQATDTMLTAFGKLQNQINGLIGSTIYQGTWNASTNTPTLASGVGVRGYYYIVSVAGNTNLDGITDWFVGDWAIFDGTAWQQVDNTDAVVSVNGQTGAVSLTTDNIPEGATNQYFLNSRARAALSFAAGSGAYNSTTGVITIPTNNNQITNGANYITLASLSGTAPIVYSNTTGAISITQSGTASNGFLSSTDWNTFNNKAPSVVGGYLPLSGGVMTGNINWEQTNNGIIWAVNTDGAYIKFYNTGDADVDSRLEFATTDNNNEYFRWVHVPSGGTLYESMRLVPNSSGNAELIVTGKIIKSGGTTSQFLKANGDVDSTAYQPLLTNPVTGTGTTNYIPKWTSSSAIGNSAIQDDGSTSIVITNRDLRITAIEPQIYLVKTGTGAGTWRILGGRNNDTFQFRIYDDNAGQDRFNIFSNGNVSVGSSSDNGYKLYNNGSFYGNGTGFFAGLLSVGYNVTTEPFVQGHFYNTSTTASTQYGGVLISGLNQAHIRFQTGSNTWGAAGVKRWQIRVGNGDNQDRLGIFSWTKGDDIINFFASGNISIGNESDAYKLDVTGTGNYNSNGTPLTLQGGGRILYFRIASAPTAGNTGVTLRTDSGSYLSLASGANPTRIGVVVDFNHNLGIQALPDASWGTSTKALQINDSGAVYDDGFSNTILANNSYYNGSANVKLKSGYSARILQEISTGDTYFQVAGTGAGGTAASYDTAVRIFQNRDSYFYGDVRIVSNEPQIYLTKTGTDAGSWRILGSTGGSLRRFRIYDQEAEADRFNIFKTSGNVGIGITTDNGYKLDVSGTGRFSGRVTSENSFYVVAAPPAGTGGELINVRDTVTAINVTSFAGVFFNSAPGSDYSIGKLTENNAGFLQIRNANNGAELVRINTVGGIKFNNLAGTGARMVVADSSGNLSTQAIPSGSSQWTTNGTKIYYNTGNVGINVSDPANLLHLAGASATPSLRLGSVSLGFYWDIGRENQTTGDFVFNNANGGSSAEILRINTAGNMGLSTGALSAWNSAARVIQFDSTKTSSVGSIGTDLHLNYNAYYDNVGWKAVTTAVASNIGLYGGAINFRVSNGSVSANSAISWVVPMQIGNNGLITYEWNSQPPVKDGLYANQVLITNSTANYQRIRFDVGSQPYWGVTREGSTNNFIISGYIGTSWTDNNFKIFQSTGNLVLNGNGTDYGKTLQVFGNLGLGGPSVYNWLVSNVNDTNWGFGMFNSGSEYYPTVYFSATSGDGNNRGFRVRNLNGGTNVLFVNSVGTLTASGDVVAFSDIRFKENIRPIENVLSRIGESRGVLYDRKDTGLKDNIGFIAQELELQFPELVNTDNDGIKSVKYQNAVAILFEAIKEQQKQINELKKQIA